MTANELILDCLRLGLDGEKVDYEWEQKDEQSAILKFEDGQRVHLILQPLK